MTYPLRTATTVTVGGVDITSHVLADNGSTIDISSILTHQVDTCKFTVQNSAALTLNAWEEVIITNGVTRLFAGYVQIPNPVHAAGGVRQDTIISACDYTCYTDHIFVKESWTVPVTDAAFLAYLFATYWPEIDATTYVQVLNTYPMIRYNWVSLRQVLDSLADGAGGDWYIDYNKKLHYFVAETNPAPYGLSDNPTPTATIPYTNFNMKKDGTGVINRVTVIGGRFLSPDTVLYLPGDGASSTILLPYRLHAAAANPISILMWRNDGTDSHPVWTPMTILLGDIDVMAVSTDLLFYFIEQKIEQLAPWPNLTKAVKIYCTYEIPLLARYSDAASYALYGKYFDYVLTNTDILDITSAKLIAAGKLLTSSMANPTITLDCYQPGLRSGQTITLINALETINTTFTIQRVDTHISTDGYCTFSVMLGLYCPDLTDILIKLARGAKVTPAWRDDEVLQDIEQTAETLTLAETTHAPTTSAGPYKWGPSANVLKWSFGKWS